MEVLVLTGAIAFVGGVLMIGFPAQLSRWNQFVTHQCSQLDPTLMRHRFGVGGSLLAVGVFCLASAYYVWLRLRQ